MLISNYILLCLIHLSLEYHSCPGGCECLTDLQNETLVHMVCSNVKAKNLTPSPLTISLYYIHVPIERLSSKYILPYDDFESPIIKISWKSSGIKDIDSTSFMRVFNLDILDLGENSIAFIHPNTFQPLTNLTFLNLTSNNISEISRNVFQNLHSLKFLYLAKNNLNRISNDFLRELKNLETLDLSENELQYIQDEDFMNNKFLQLLKLDKNFLRHLPPSSFKNLNYLIELDLSDNYLHTLSGSVLECLKSLKFLNLESNYLNFISEELFIFLYKLKVLNLSGNPLNGISDNAFRNCKNLEILYLNNTNLVSLNSNHLKDLVELKQFFAFNTFLTDVSSYLFINNKKLEIIDLSSNTLSVLPFSLVGLPGLDWLNVSNNPLVCDCHNSWFLNWAEKHSSVVNLKELHCDKSKDVNNFFNVALKNLSCEKYLKSERSVVFELGYPVVLDCMISSSYNSIVWITPQGISYKAVFPEYPVVDMKSNVCCDSVVSSSNLTLLSNGSLYIPKILRDDCGIYTCFLNDSYLNISLQVTVQLDPITFYHIKIASIITGIVSAAAFLTITVIVQLIKKCLKRCGCILCPCDEDEYDEDSPRIKQVYQILDSLENYKTQQLEKLRENYNMQVQKIKDNCAQQLEWICDSYHNQVQNFKDIRDYGTSHLTSIKEQYCDQVRKVKEYSGSQLSWVRENYVFQRNRIRKFSSHQVLRFRESYKYQQQTLNKVLENLPSFYLDNCRNGSCSKSDSSNCNNEDAESVDIYIKIKRQDISQINFSNECMSNSDVSREVNTSEVSKTTENNEQLTLKMASISTSKSSVEIFCDKSNENNPLLDEASTCKIFKPRKNRCNSLTSLPCGEKISGSFKLSRKYVTSDQVNETAINPL